MAGEPLRVALLGAGGRMRGALAPVVHALPGVEPVGVWSRSMTSAGPLGEELGLPAYDDLDALVAERDPQIAVVGVSAEANGEIALAALHRKLHVLLETPIAQTVADADAVILAAQNVGRQIEVAEQFHRRPIEALKLRCIEMGVFGRVHTAFVDSEGHGYHGASLMRAFLGLDARIARVIGLERSFPLADPDHAEDFQQHGFVELDNGSLGVFKWSGPAYFSSVRPSEGSRFHAERGGWRSIRLGGRFDHHVELVGATEPGRGITIEREAHPDTDTTLALHADLHDGSSRRISWHNPFADAVAEQQLAWSDDTIAIADCLRSLTDAISTNGAPTYGPIQARRDLVLCEAMGDSARENGAPVDALSRDRD